MSRRHDPPSPSLLKNATRLLKFAWVFSPSPLWQNAQYGTVYALRNLGCPWKLTSKSFFCNYLQSAPEDGAILPASATLVHLSERRFPEMSKYGFTALNNKSLRRTL